MKKEIFLTLCYLLAGALAFAQPQQNGRVYRVALFVPSGAELLDFAGPGEVFSQAPGFEVYLVGLTEEPVKSQGFLSITPNYSYNNCPRPDIILVPGGGTGRIINDPAAIQWIKDHYDNGGTVLTVCTGASVAAKAGLLEGKKATTYHSAFDYVKSYCSDCELLPGTRYVDNGRIITTAGISAGIDGALHLVSRIKGKDVAEEAARNMEYDKWAPGEGYMNYQNEFVQYLKQYGPVRTRQHYQSELAGPAPLFFVGEIKNLAAELSAAGKQERAVEMLEFGAAYYPGEVIIYNQMRALYAEMGRPVPPAPEEFMEKALQGDADGTLALYKEAKEQFPGWALFEESRMNWVGYQLLRQEKPEAAVKIFQLNAEAYPSSWNAYDSLAEGYLNTQQWDKARKYYLKSLELNPDNDNARKMMEGIKER